jgi:O-antigen/teichoic acid export membrane protein
MYILFQFLLKSRIQFYAMSTQQFFFSFFYPICTLICAFFAGIPGYILGQALSAMIMVFFIYRISTLRVNIEFSWESFKRLSIIGMPLMGAGLLFGLLTTVDRWVILAHLGIKDLGQYTVSILIFGALSIVPLVISQQMYPRMAYRYGETGSTFSLLPMIATQSLSAFTATLPLIVIAYFFVPFLVSEFMPQYSEGILPARITLIGLLIFPLAGGVANFLNTIGKQFFYMLVQAVAVVINFFLATLFINFGWGLNGVAIAGAMTFFLYTSALCVGGFVIVIKQMRQHRNV